MFCVQRYRPHFLHYTCPYMFWRSPCPCPSNRKVGEEGCAKIGFAADFAACRGRLPICHGITMHKNLGNYKFQKRSLSNNRWTGGILSWYHTCSRLMDQFLNRAFVLYLSTRRTYINMSQSTIHTHILDLRAFYHHNIHIWMNVLRATRGSVSCPRHAD